MMWIPSEVAKFEIKEPNTVQVYRDFDRFYWKKKDFCLHSVTLNEIENL